MEDEERRRGDRMDEGMLGKARNAITSIRKWGLLKLGKVFLISALIVGPPSGKQGELS